MKTNLQTVTRWLSALAIIALTLSARAQTCTDIPPNLVAWWRAETNALDSLGTNHGMLSNIVSFTAGKVGTGFTFGLNGIVEVPHSASLSNQQFTIEAWARPDGPGPGPVNDAFGNILIAKSLDGGNAVVIYWRATDSRFLFRFGIAGTEQQILSVNAFPPGQFYHVAASYDGATFRLYVNGTIEGQFALVKNISYDPAQAWLIGNSDKAARDVGYERRWMGVIDELSMFNRALTSNEVAAIYAAGSAGKCTDKPYFLTLDPLPDGGVGTPYSFQFAAAVTPGPHTFSILNGTLPPGLELTTSGLLYGTPAVGTTNSLTILATSSLGQTNSHTFALQIQDEVCPAPSGLVGWWRGQGDGLDAVGTNHGTLQSGVAFAAGKVGQAFRFDGSANSFVTLPNSPAFLPSSGQFTIDAWIKPNFAVNNVWDNILTKRDGCSGSGISYLFSLNKGDPADAYGAVVLAMTTGGGVSRATSGSATVPNDGQFHHVAGTYDGSMMKVYLDGQLVGQLARSGPLAVSSTAPTIGHHGGDCPQRANAIIDEIDLFDRALSSNEVAAIYAAGAGNKCGLLYMTSLSPMPGAGESATYSQAINATGGTTPYNFTLLSGALPAGMSLSTNGVLSGTPTVPGVSDFTVRVTDAQTRPADRHFFLKVNARPVLPVIASQSVNELATLTVTNAATDVDPLDTLSYALINSPTNASISGSGVITWSPTEADGPATTNLTTVVTDNGEPNLSRTNTFAVTVNELNLAPVLTLPANTNINELVAFTANASATDADLPTNALAFEKVSGPGNLTVSPGGVINWTPTENDGPGTHTARIRVFDTSPLAVNATSLSVTSSFDIVVNEVNVAPVLGTLTNRTANPGQTISFSATATDSDFPANTLSFSLVSPPLGADISSGGLFTWRPAVALADTTNTIQVRVQDNGDPVLNDVKSFTVIVNSFGAAVVLKPVSFTGGQFSLQVSGPTGPDYVLLTSTNLTQWSDVQTNLSPTPPFQFNDTVAGSFSNRVYRVRLQP